VPTFSLEDAKTIGEQIGIDWDTSAFGPEELLAGMEVELEHGSKLGSEVNVTEDDPAATAKIAWAHLLESPRYYVELAKMEEALEEEEKTAIHHQGCFHRRVAKKDELASWLRDNTEMTLQAQLDLESIWNEALEEARQEFKLTFGDDVEFDPSLLREVGLTPAWFTAEAGKEIKKVASQPSDNEVSFWRKELQKIVEYLWVELVGPISLPSDLIKTLGSLLLEAQMLAHEDGSLDAFAEAEDTFHTFLNAVELYSNLAFNLQSREELWHDLKERAQEETGYFIEEIADVAQEGAQDIKEYLIESVLEKAEEYYDLFAEYDEPELEDMSPQELQRYLREEREYGPR
jgi:hypothetical protein